MTMIVFFSSCRALSYLTIRTSEVDTQDNVLVLPHTVINVSLAAKLITYVTPWFSESWLRAVYFYFFVKCILQINFIFQATDRDVGKNSKICFTLTDGNVGNVFSINHSRYLSFKIHSHDNLKDLIGFYLILSISRQLPLNPPLSPPSEINLLPVINPPVQGKKVNKLSLSIKPPSPNYCSLINERLN